MKDYFRKCGQRKPRCNSDIWTGEKAFQVKGKNSKVLGVWERAWHDPGTERRPVWPDVRTGRVVRDNLEREHTARFCTVTQTSLLPSYVTDKSYWITGTRYLWKVCEYVWIMALFKTHSEKTTKCYLTLGSGCTEKILSMFAAWEVDWAIRTLTGS